jgi:glyoxalase superfamily protein
MLARLSMIVLDCPDPWALAPFYEKLTGMKQTAEGPTYVCIGSSTGDIGLAFQKVDDYRPPRWPNPAYPQQYHMDFEVDDLDTAEELALSLGATVLPGRGEHYRVFADPVGHPFCLCC